MIAYLKSNPIKSAIYTFLLLTMIAAVLKIIVTSRKPKSKTAANNPSLGMRAAMPSASPTPMDPTIFAFMQQNHLGPKTANYIAQAKTHILDQTDTSVHLSITFPDKLTIDETRSLGALLTIFDIVIPSAANARRLQRKTSAFLI